MAARRPFWKWHRWKSIGFCLWPPSTCIWNLKSKFQSKLDLCSGNHVVYRQTDGRTDGQTDKVNPVYPPSNFVGRGYNEYRKISNIRRTKPQTINVSRLGLQLSLHNIYWNQVWSGWWRCSWSSADRRCSNYIWVINCLLKCALY